MKRASLLLDVGRMNATQLRRHVEPVDFAEEDPALSKIPIIMMSAVGESLVRERFSGYTAFLRKPFRISALIDTVRRVMG